MVTGLRNPARIEGKGENKLSRLLTTNARYSELHGLIQSKLHNPVSLQQKHLRLKPYLPEEQLSHRQETLSEQVEQKDLLCFFGDFFLSYANLGISRNPLDLLLLSLEACTVH